MKKLNVLILLVILIVLSVFISCSKGKDKTENSGVNNTIATTKRVVNKTKPTEKDSVEFCAQTMIGIESLLPEDRKMVINFIKSHISEIRDFTNTQSTFDGWAKEIITRNTSKAYIRSVINDSLITKRSLARKEAWKKFYKIPTLWLGLEEGSMRAKVDVQILIDNAPNFTKEEWELLSDYKTQEFEKKHPVENIFENWGDMTPEVISLLREIIK